MMKFKVGDYVETDWNSAGVEAGEQGLIVDDHNQDHLGLLFPARTDIWSEDDGRNWQVTSKQLKLLYRPRVKATEYA